MKICGNANKVLQILIDMQKRIELRHFANNIKVFFNIGYKFIV